MELEQLVSIIIPVYNVEKYITQCIESVKNQTYKNFEAIIVNDGSTDRSVEICQGIINKDPRFKILNKENGGLSDARNKGIEHANGEYIIFVDSDDWLELNMLERMMCVACDTNADMVIIGHTIAYENQPKKYWKKFSSLHNEKVIQYSKEDALEALFKNVPFSNSAWAKLYAKKLFENIRFPTNKLYEDIFVMYNLFDKCKKVDFIAENGYYYRQRKGSITNSKFTARHLDWLEAIEKQKEFSEKKCFGKYNKEITVTYIKAGINILEMSKCSKDKKQIKDYVTLRFREIPFEYQKKLNVLDKLIFLGNKIGFLDGVFISAKAFARKLMRK